MGAFWIALLGGLLVFVLLAVPILRNAPKNRDMQKERMLRYTAASGVHSAQAGDGKQEQKPRSFRERIWEPALKYMAAFARRLTPKGIRNMLEVRIMHAGRQYVWNPNVMAFFWLLSVAGIALFMFSLGGNYSFIQRIALAVLGAVFGMAMPFVVLNTIIQRRQERIRRQLPEILDLLCVSVQAGLSFDGAMGSILQRMKGPFIDECDKVMRDVRMGMTRRLALQNMAKRCDLQEVSLFTTSIIQAERLGTSMSKTLLVQADNMRERRRQYVKAQALKAPVKMLLPLVLFIYPALFVVVLLPSLLAHMKSFKM